MSQGGAQPLSPICAYVAERTGTSLSRQQVARLTEALSGWLNGRSEVELLRHLQSVRGTPELAQLMAVISVHKTDLFRDELQLNAFTEHVLEPLIREKKRPLRLWSAGCATGEEVATLLILLAQHGADPRSTVLGTDIAEPALAQARQLCFHRDLLGRVPVELRGRYFQQAEGKGWVLSQELRARARFARHNLMDTPYPQPVDGGSFDVIFCRNVLIYFTDSAFDRTVAGLVDRLEWGGSLVLSSAEPILRAQPHLVTVRRGEAFFYEKSDAPPAPPAAPPRGKVTPSAPAPSSAHPRPAPAPAQVPEVDRGEDPRLEARRIFELVMDWSAEGTQDAETEKGLRRALYLDPHFAQARYLLGMLIEQRGAKAEAASEYRRALGALREGRALATAFFLNDERLQKACLIALARLGYPQA